MSTIPQQSGSGIQPIALVSQLQQQVLNMKHIDEMFSWMSHTMVNQWQIPLIQFWAPQAYNTGRVRLVLRAVASQDASLPASLHANYQTANVVKHLLRERECMTARPIASVFSSSQVEKLTLYGLRYWAGYFVGNTIMLPPKKDASIEQVATPLTMLISLFLRQPPSDRLKRAIDFTFHHGILVATNRGLLTTAPDTSQSVISATSIHQHIQLPLSTLIPHRSESIEEISTSNPFSHATAIPNKSARQLYSLINGQRDVDTLVRMSEMNYKEAEEALRLLLQQQKIQLQDVQGNIVDASVVH